MINPKTNKPQRNKLNQKQVNDIRDNYLAYVRSYKYFANKYNVGESTIRDVIHYKTWSRA